MLSICLQCLMITRKEIWFEPTERVAGGKARSARLTDRLATVKAKKTEEEVEKEVGGEGTQEK